MSQPSDWPLSKGAVRLVVPEHLVNELAEHPVSAELYPTALGFYPHAMQHAMRRLKHDDYLMIYVVEGEGRLMTTNGQQVLVPGNVFIIPPGHAHEYAANTSKPWSIFWVHFRGHHAVDYFKHLSSSEDNIALNSLVDLGLQNEFRALVDAAYSAFVLADFVYCANRLKQLLSYMELRLRRHQERPGEIPLERLNTYMREHLHSTLTLDQLAAFCHLSKFYFARRYKSLTGVSPLQHFTQMKVEQACLLLENSVLSVSEVAFELGYEDALYFSRVFRKHKGLSPGQYREHKLPASKQGGDA